MARLFDDAGTEKGLYTGSGPVTNEPLTLACWFYADQSKTHRFVGLGQNAAWGGWSIGAFADNTTVASKEGNTGPTSTSQNVSGFSLNVWNHIAGVFTSDTARQVYQNGSAGTLNTDNISDPSAIDFVAVGVWQQDAAYSPTSGRIADAAIWNVALSVVEIQALARGIPAIRIRPTALVAYWPLWGFHSPEIDLHPRSAHSGNFPLTLTGTVAANHAPVLPFTRRLGSQLYVPAAAAFIPKSRRFTEDRI